MKDINFAIDHEQHGILMYESFAKNFNEAIFDEILNIKKTGFEMLKNLSNQSENLSENLQANHFNYDNVQNLDDALELSLGYEIKTAILYDEISTNLEDETQRDLIFRLWATSQNEYKKALQNRIYEIQNNISVNNGEQVNNGEENSQKDNKSGDERKHKYSDENQPNFGNLGFDREKIDELTQIFQKFSQNKADKDDIVKILNNPYTSFFAGAALGGLGGILLNQILSKNEDE